MPELVRKVLPSVGVYYPTKDQPFAITDQRYAHWAATHDAMKAAGLKVPVPYSHMDGAKPKTDDELAAWRTKYNAGFVDSIKREAGEWAVYIAPASDDDAKRLGANVQEISPEILPVFRDGQNREWTDAITHMAAVTHPVAGNQTNFEAVAAQFSLKHPGAVRLSLAMRGEPVDAAIRFALDDEDDDDMDLDGDGESNDADPDDDGDGIPDAVDQEPEVPTDPDPKAGVDFEKVRQVLADHGIVLPAEAHPDNLDQLLVAIMAAGMSKGAAESKADAKEATDPDMGDEMPMDPNANPGQLQEAPMTGVAMSLDNPLVKALQTELVNAKRSELVRRVDGLRQTRRVSSDQHKALREEAKAVQFGLTKAGTVKPTPVHYKLDALEALPEGVLATPAEKVNPAASATPRQVKFGLTPAEIPEYVEADAGTGGDLDDAKAAAIAKAAFRHISGR